MMQSKQHVIAKGAMSAAPTMLGISSRSNIASSQQSSSASSYTPASLVSTRSTGVSSRPASRQQSISRRGVKTAAGNGGGLQIDLTGERKGTFVCTIDQRVGGGLHVLEVAGLQ
eukprot:1146110-Pelagomonas_calceolata.AAC.11